MIDKELEKSELMNARPYKCYHCQGVLGVTTDNFLYLGATRRSKHQTFDCMLCDKTTFWKPKDEILNKNK